MPSRKRCGSRSRYQRSLKVPGSPSSMLTAIRRGSGSAATLFHLRPTGKPAPPRPRSPESSMILVMPSRVCLPGEAVGDQLVAAVLLVGGEVDVVGLRTGDLLLRETALLHRLDGRVADWVLSHHHHRGDFAAADAGRVQHPHVLAEDRGKLGEQVVGARPARRRSSRTPAPSAPAAGSRLPSPRRSGGRRSPPRRPRSATGSSPAPAPPGARPRDGRSGR